MSVNREHERRGRSQLTFKTRQRSMTEPQLADLERLEKAYGLAVEGPMVQTPNPVALEIGSGYGDALVAMAGEAPEALHIGCEVHAHGLLRTLQAVEQQELENVRVVRGDALRFSRRFCADSLAKVRIYFPDPWPKARHRSRRLVTPDRVASLVGRLENGGSLHIATDVADYVEQTLRVCAAFPELEGGMIDRPAWRPITKYERKAWREGRVVTDLLFHRRSGEPG